jgi:hypothetical protein
MTANVYIMVFWFMASWSLLDAGFEVLEAVTTKIWSAPLGW